MSNRRQALRQLAAFIAASPIVAAQQDPFRDHSRVPWLDELRTAYDFEPVAYARLARSAYDYTAYGSESEYTLRRNRHAFEWFDLAAKATIDAAQVDTSVELCGRKFAYPILIAPTAAHIQLHPNGEAGTYRGAAAASDTPFIISHNASTTVDKIAAAAKGTLWWQLYPRQDLATNQELLAAAQTAGAQAIVVTVDQQAAIYERSLHDRNLTDRRPNQRGRTRGADHRYRIWNERLWYNWAFFDQIRPLIKVPMLAKGILTPEDAKLALDHGVEGIIVSNHGGRAMDYSPSTLEVLPEIVDAVNGRVPVLIDGGFRRGTDILKALALGAKAVCLGRVPRWGLAAYGPGGVQRVLEILQAELKLAMAQAGCKDTASATRSLVAARPRTPVPAAPTIAGEPTGRLTPLAEFACIPEFEAMAARKLEPATFALIAGSDRQAFDNYTFRPRVMVDTTKMDLAIELCGQPQFAPIVVAPLARQQRFHPDAERATIQGAAAAKTTVIVSADSSTPLDKLPAEAKTPLWLQTNANAVKPIPTGFQALVITINTPVIPWAQIDRHRKGVTIPVLLKGILTSEEARQALQHGVQGIIVSTYERPSKQPALQALPAIAAALDGKLPILIDGSFRRGTDILKALILGANAVLLGRPILWALATYGAPGVQTVLEMAQTELARNMAMLGAPTPKALHRGMLRT
ncbi:MAG: alpha-hydroxy-acid oxidizing protein [Bryobacterales bacterium]|nr:alpha-hydroxy-acid oxidizing protein [Bryobacterales bacterium]